MKMSTPLNKPVKVLLKEIKDKTATFLENKKNANNLIDIISKAEENQNAAILLACIKSFHKIFSKAITSEEMYSEKQLDSEKELNAAEKFKLWLKNRYIDAQNLLLRMLQHREASVQELALCTLIKFIEAEGQTPLKKITGNHIYFPSNNFEAILKSLISSEANLSSLIGRFQEYMEYDDIRYFSMKIALKNLNEKTEKDRTDVYLTNVHALLDNLTMPQATSENSDTLKKFIAKCPDQSENIKMISLKEHKKLFTTVWLQFLKHKLPTALYKKVLLVLHDKVMPFMTSPLLLSDFLTNSYNIGGAISLLALNGLFILVHNYNLEYPDFYKKLYALFEPTVFHVKYSARFFYLSNLFLSSTHLPSYLVAAFAKRLSRLALTAPPSSLTVILPFVYNLLIRHPSCEVLLHRPTADNVSEDPFDMQEEDPAKCNALESSLWELKTIQSHYHHSIGTEARKMEQHLPGQEIQLDEILDTTADELMEKEVKKKIKTIATNFEKPTVLFSNKDPMSEFWTLT